MSAGRAAQCPALPDPALLALRNPFAGSTPGAHGAQPLAEDYLSILQAQQAQQANSEFQEYLNTLPGQDTAWGGDAGAGLAHMGSKAEGMCHAPCSAGCASVTTVPCSRLCTPARLPAVATRAIEAYAASPRLCRLGPRQPCKTCANVLRHSAGADVIGHVTEQHMYDGRPSVDSRRSSDSNYIPGLANQEYLPHCEPIDEYMSIRT